MNKNSAIAALHPKDKGSGGGAWLGTLRLAMGAYNLNSDFRFITLFVAIKNTSYPFVKALFVSKAGTLFYYFNSFIERITHIFILKVGTQTKFSFNISSVFNFYASSIRKFPYLYLHWAGNNFISVFALHQLSANHKKIVIKFADYWWISGGCHYPKNCTGYLDSHCSDCPYVKSIFKLVPSLCWQLKHSFLSSKNVAIAVPSLDLHRITSSFAHLKDKTHHISNGFPINHEHTPFFGLNNPVLGVVCHGFSDPRKNFDLIKQLIRMTSQSKREVHICGDSSDILYSELTLDQKKYVVNYSMIQNQSGMNAFYASCSHLLFLSIQDNSPNQLMEAMCHGLVVLSFDVGFVREHIRSGVNGYIFPVSYQSQLNQFFHDICNVFDLSLKRQNVSQEAFAYAKRTFSLDRMARQYLELFN